MADLEFYFDVVSPASYLAHKQLPALTARTQVEIIYQPLLLGGILKSAGNAPPITVPAKRRYMFMDFLRIATHIDAPMRMNPFFPMNTLPIQRALSGWKDEARFHTLLDAAFNAIWVDSLNVADPEVLTQVLRNVGLSPDDFWSAANHPDNKIVLKDATEQAVSRGAFGAPTFFLNDEMFFGQDRLFLIEARLNNPPESNQENEASGV